MPYPAPFDPDCTVAALWRRRLMGTRPDGKAHWRTKVTYYTAVCEVIAAAPGQTPSWQQIVAAVRCRGARSTFYEVTGGSAKHPLLRAYKQAATAEALQIAMTFQRRRAADQLIDEAKVWAFWPFREAWAKTRRPIERGDAAAADYAGIVADWSRHNPCLAAVIDCSPPMCAVEDYVALAGGNLPAIRAHALLRATIERAAAEGEDDEEAHPLTPSGAEFDIAWTRRSAWPPPCHADPLPPSVPVTGHPG